MAIVTLREILRDAEKNQYGVGMFDVHNLEMTNAAIEAAEREHSPVIIALAEVHVHSVRQLEAVGSLAVYAARRARVPVAVHYDHGGNMENLLRVMHLGFSSVMYDGSTMPYEENVCNTAQVARLAKVFGCSVEGELGHVGGGEDGGDDGCALAYTDPVQAADFVEGTGVDALAVSIGTVHGVYRQQPKLDLERLRAIKAGTHVPLVLHGGSGLSEKDFLCCIQSGISKINIYTETVQAAMERIERELTTRRAMPTDGSVRLLDYPDLMTRTTEEICGVIAARLRLFGSSGRA